MDITSLLVNLLAGAAGGNAAGAAMKDYSLGTVGNSIAGLVGGGIGGQLLAMAIPALGGAAAGGGMDLAGIVGQLAGGGVGGAVVMLIIGVIKQKMAAN